MAIKKQEKQGKGKDKKKQKEDKKGILIATTQGKDLPISTKKAVAICAFIKGKKTMEVLEDLDKVLRKKIAVPMKGEIPHRRGMPKGKFSGRYPVKAGKEFIKLIQNLNANATIKGMDPETLIIFFAKADKAASPFRGTRIAYGRKFLKRSHVLIKALESEELKEEKRNEEEKKKAKKEKQKPQKQKVEKKVEEKKEEKKIEGKVEEKKTEIKKEEEKKQEEKK